MALKLGRRNSMIVASLLLIISAMGSGFPELFLALSGRMFLIPHRFHPLPHNWRCGRGSGIHAFAHVHCEISRRPKGATSFPGTSCHHFRDVVVYFVNYTISRQGNEEWLHAFGWRWMFFSETIPGVFVYDPALLRT
jgi:SP family xylose:H+ symportor-like MFS transporter